jgi:hypothetical protein
VTFPAGGTTWDTATTLTFGDSSTPAARSGYTFPYYPAWWKFTATSTAPVTLDSFGTVGDGTGFEDTMLTVYSGASLGSAVVVASNDEAGSDNPAAPSLSRVTFTPVVGTEYHVKLQAFGSTGSHITTYVLTATAAPDTPPPAPSGSLGLDVGSATTVAVDPPLGPDATDVAALARRVPVHRVAVAVPAPTLVDGRPV